MTILFKTYDIFNMKDKDKREYCLLRCIDIALQCGLMYKCHVHGRDTRLYLNGTKQQFAKYYLKTLTCSESIFDGLKRLLYCITW
jgi:hypothetical protein